MCFDEESNDVAIGRKTASLSTSQSFRDEIVHSGEDVSPDELQVVLRLFLVG